MSPFILVRMGIDPGEGSPNLDDQSEEDLRNFWYACQRNTKDMARLMFPKQKQRKKRKARRAVRDLGRYAINKCAAMSCRTHGSIQGALAYEKACELAYDDLPAWARW